MNNDFHYYATYCSAYLAGYSHEECLEICYSAQLVDWCTRTFLSKLKAPLAAATTQLSLELMDERSDSIGIQDITRIWSSFHFLPYDLHAKKPHCSKRYLNKYRLICKPNGDLLAKTVNLAKGKSLQAVGIAMHVLADTWAHKNFAGTPSLVINNINYYIYELLPDDEGFTERPIKFSHNPSAKDDIENSVYVNTIYQDSENAIMNLGHGRAGHLPDYSFIRYKYLPAWAEYEEELKDNPSDYYHAVCQMVYAMKYLRGEYETFEKCTYDIESVGKWEKRIKDIIGKRRLNAAEDWKALGEELSGEKIVPFELERYHNEFTSADDKENTFLGKFINAALAQKSMVSTEIYQSGNKLAGHPVNPDKEGFKKKRRSERSGKKGKGGKEI